MFEFIETLLGALYRGYAAYRRFLQTLDWWAQMLLAGGLALCYVAMNVQLPFALARISQGQNGLSLALALPAIASAVLLGFALKRIRPNLRYDMSGHLQRRNAAISFVTWCAIMILTIAFLDSHVGGGGLLYALLLGPAWLYFAVMGYLAARAFWRYWSR